MPPVPMFSAKRFCAPAKSIPKNPEDLELIRGLLANRADAWRELIQRFGPIMQARIRRIICRFPGLVSLDEVEDVYSNLLVALNARDMHKLRCYEPGRGRSLASWLGMLASHSAWDYLRSVQRRRSTQATSDVENLPCVFGCPEESLLQEQRRTWVSSLLADLSDRDRDFVRLYYMDGEEAEDVAASMNISVKTVYTKKHKIQARLASEVQRVELATA